MRALLVMASSALGAAIGAPLAAWASPAQDYVLYCQGCHGPQAQGVAGKVPPLAGALALFMRSAAGRDYVMRVPGAANSALSDARLAAVLNWVAITFNNGQALEAAPFSTAEVSQARHQPLASVLAARRAVVRALAASGAAAPAESY